MNLPDAGPEKKRKAYTSPRLTVYGDLREITRTNDQETGKLDGVKAFKTS